MAWTMEKRRGEARGVEERETSGGAARVASLLKECACFSSSSLSSCAPRICLSGGRRDGARYQLARADP